MLDGRKGAVCLELQRGQENLHKKEKTIRKEGNT